MMSEIKPISATRFRDEEGGDVYRLLNMIHVMAGQDATKGAGKWALSKTATFSDFVLTSYTNGVVEIKAETHKDYEGLATSHTYSMLPVTEEE